MRGPEVLCLLVLIGETDRSRFRNIENGVARSKEYVTQNPHILFELLFLEALETRKFHSVGFIAASTVERYDVVRTRHVERVILSGNGEIR